MRIVWMWVVPLILVACIIGGVSYFESGGFHRSSGTAPATVASWVVVPHPPGDRVRPQVPIVKEFGSWHLACSQAAQHSVPQVGYVQNLGIVKDDDQTGKPERCHVFLLMRNPASPTETMLMNFRYLKGLDTPELAVIYSSPQRQHLLFEPSGRVHDMTRKEKWQAGFYTDPSRAPGADKLKVQHDETPTVDIAVGAMALKLRTAICIRGRCIARENLSSVPEVQHGTRIAVGVPVAPRSPKVELDVPSDGLQQALAELARMRTS